MILLSRERGLGEMIRKAVLGLALAMQLLGQDAPKGHEKALIWSIVGMEAANMFDMGTSIGQIEANPALGANQRFGARGVGIKVGLGAGAALASFLLHKRHPEMDRTLIGINSAETGLFTWAGVHNLQNR